MQKNSGPGWPLAARAGKVTLTFGGSLKAERIGKERLSFLLERVVDILLWSLLLLGLLALAASAYSGFQAWGSRYLWEGRFLWEGSAYSFVFWLSALTDLYLWARRARPAA
ncbi:MAG: hypothetical protein M1400_02085, partial [Patescibacteria group bacterium]|nr:hypothetical protein [Patescibacteria group bacterium]